MNINKKDIARFWSKVDKTPGLGPNGECWQWMAYTNTNGYGTFWIDNTNAFAHRIAYLISGGQFTIEKPYGLHKCDNAKCVRPEHIWAGNEEDNRLDKLAKGRQNKGMQVNTNKLTNLQVLEIYKKYHSNERIAYTHLAKEYGVLDTTIERICNQKTWKWLTKDIGIEPRITTYQQQGSEKLASKLKNKQVLEILKMEGNLSRNKIGKIYGVHESTIRGIFEGRIWSWLTGRKQKSN